MSLRNKICLIIGFLVVLAIFGSCSNGHTEVPTTATTVNPTPTTSKSVTVTTHVVHPVTTITIARQVTSTTVQKPVTTTTTIKSARECLVSGYTRKDGTTVNSYYRSC